jgi:hypothetical protein
MNHATPLSRMQVMQNRLLARGTEAAGGATESRSNV